MDNRTQKGKTKTQTKQKKLYDCNLRSSEATKASDSMATLDANEEHVEEGLVVGKEDRSVDGKVDRVLDMLGTVKSDIATMKTDFTTKLDNMTAAIRDLKEEMGEFSERVTQAEHRISGTEDEVQGLQAKVSTLQTKNKIMEDKILDLEARSRLNNLRLVNMPEGAEGTNVCAFLERWIPETLGGEKTPLPQFVLERAHRIGQKRDNTSRPRALIMRFLNHRDKQVVLQAARDKKNIHYNNQQVRFYSDMASGLLQQRKEFDPIREELRKMNIRHGVAYPAKLLVTYREKTYVFKTPAEGNAFLKNIKEVPNYEEQ